MDGTFVPRSTTPAARGENAPSPVDQRRYVKIAQPELRDFPAKEIAQFRLSDFRGRLQNVQDHYWKVHSRQQPELVGPAITNPDAHFSEMGIQTRSRIARDNRRAQKGRSLQRL